MGKAPQHRFIKPHRIEKFGGAGAARRPAHALVNYKRLADDVFHSQAGIERTERVLKNNLHVAAEAAHFAAAGGEQVASLEVNTARTRLDQSKDQPAECALPGSRLAN